MPIDVIIPDIGVLAYTAVIKPRETIIPSIIANLVGYKIRNICSAPTIAADEPIVHALSAVLYDGVFGTVHLAVCSVFMLFATLQYLWLVIGAWGTKAVDCSQLYMSFNGSIKACIYKGI